MARLTLVAAIVAISTTAALDVHSVIVSTSVSRTTPSLDHLRACVSAVASHPALADVPLYVVADAIPTAAEAASLPSVDRDKWAPLWAAKGAAYRDEYLPRVARLLDQTHSRATLVELPAFGHLVGTVRAGLDACGAAGDDAVLFLQHDLALDASVVDARALRGCVAALRAPGARVDYVLLNRDDNAAPRANAWLSPLAPLGAAEAAAVSRAVAAPAAREAAAAAAAAAARAPALRRTRGFSDQTHLARAGWYREVVLGACGGRRTCMEHALHAAHGAAHGPALDGLCVFDPTVPDGSASSDRPPVRDLDHGSMVRRAVGARALGYACADALRFEPLPPPAGAIADDATADLSLIHI